ncbi:MAG: hypothetical protein ACQESG_07795 [Nanobdellota archaeon]
MGVLDIGIAGRRVPAYDIATLLVGFYAGYWEAKGVYTSATEAAKYLPTGGAMAISATRSLYIGATNCLVRWLGQESRKHDVHPRFSKAVDTLEDHLTENSFKPLVAATTRTMVETSVGYAAGYLYALYT